HRPQVEGGDRGEHHRPGDSDAWPSHGGLVLRVPTCCPGRQPSGTPRYWIAPSQPPHRATATCPFDLWITLCAGHLPRHGCPSSGLRQLAHRKRGNGAWTLVPCPMSPRLERELVRHNLQQPQVFFREFQILRQVPVACEILIDRE